MGSWNSTPPEPVALAQFPQTLILPRPVDKNGNPCHLLKLLIVGEHSFGKSSLIKRFVEDTFTDPYISTIGMEFKIKNLEIGDQTCKLQIWDTAGEERFSPTASSVYRAAHGIMVACDLSQELLNGNLSRWLIDIKNSENKDVKVLLVGTKCDQATRASFEDMQAFADENNITCIETSSKEDINVERAFTTLACEICGFPNPYTRSAAKSARK